MASRRPTRKDLARALYDTVILLTMPPNAKITRAQVVRHADTLLDAYGLHREIHSIELINEYPEDHYP